MLDAFGDCPLGESGVEGRVKKKNGAHENNAHHNHHRMPALHRARRRWHVHRDLHGQDEGSGFLVSGQMHAGMGIVTLADAWQKETVS